MARLRTFLAALAAVAVVGATGYDNCVTLSFSPLVQLAWSIADGRIALKATAAPSSGTVWLALGLANSAQNAMFSNGLCSDVLLTGSGATCPTNATCLPGSGCTACADDLWICNQPSSTEQGSYLLTTARDSVQNWNVTAVSSNATSYTIEANRALVTGDPNDIAITPGVHQVVIWAMGEFIGGEYYKHRTDTRASYVLDFGMSSVCSDVAPASNNLNSFTSPDGSYSATWSVSTDGTFMDVNVTALTTGWAAFGLNTGPSMVNGDVVVAYVDAGGHAVIYDGYATQYLLPSPDTVLGGTNDISLTTVSQSGTTLSFSFRRPLQTNDTFDHSFQKNDLVYLMYAVGGRSGATLLQHSVKGTEQVNLFDGNTVAGSVQLVVAHAAMMVVAWVLLYVSGILVGHFYQREGWWYHAHIAVQIIASIVFFTAIILVFSYFHTLRPSSHAAVGVTVLALVCLQLVLGGAVHFFKRAQKVGPILHRWNGRIIYLLALVNLFLGAAIYNSSVYIIGILGIWTGVLVIMVVVVKIIAVRQSRKADDLPTNGNDMPLMRNGSQDSINTKNAAAIQAGSGSAPPSRLINQLLGVLASLSVIAAAVLIYFIVSSPPTALLQSTAPDGSDLSASITSVRQAFSRYNVPGVVTSYVCYSFAFDTKNTRDVYKFEPVVGMAVGTDNAQVVHHMILYRVPQPIKLGQAPWDCSSMPSGASPIWVWAVGGGTFNLPSGVGLRLGGSTGVQYSVLQIHYDQHWSSNPATLGEVDSSGVRMFLSDELQPQQMGIMRFGVKIKNITLQPGIRNITISGTCPSSQTQGLPYSLNVFAQAHHMHLLGSSFKMERFHNNASVGVIGETKHWDFNLQSFLAANLTINAGDAIATTCSYDTTSVTTVTKGGEASNNEMCFGFLFYYPRLLTAKGADIDACNA